MQKKCTRCGIEQPLDPAHFGTRKTKTAQGWRWDSWCRECYQANTKRNNTVNPERKKQRNKEWREKQGEDYKERRRLYRERLPLSEKERRRIHAKAHNNKVKRRAMDAYGGVCQCCSESILEFLTLDHINNDGNAHRKTLRGVGSGGVLYSMLERQGWPKGYMTLCMNCNWARHWSRDKRCPHELACQELLGISPNGSVRTNHAA